MEHSNSFVSTFVSHNFKTIIACIGFMVGMYIQHQQNMVKIEHLENQLALTNAKLEAQYLKLDDMKLDKAVFEATMKQFTDMSEDIRQIRDRIDGILGNHHHKQGSYN